MKAGRELDKRVAEEVMNWQWGQATEDGMGWLKKDGSKTVFCSGGSSMAGSYYKEFRPSTHIEHAWIVREELPMLFFCGQTTNGSYWVKLTYDRVIPRRIYGNSLPHAICLAALDWVKSNPK